MRRQTKKVNLLADIQKTAGRSFTEILYIFQQAVRSDDKYAQALVNNRQVRNSYSIQPVKPPARKISMHFRLFRIEECLTMRRFYPSYTDCDQNEPEDDNGVQVVISMEQSSDDSVQPVRPLIGAFATLPFVDDL